MLNLLKRAGSLLLLGTFEAAAIVALHRLGGLTWMRIPWDGLEMWLELAPLEDVVAAILRTLALGIAYWVAASSALYTLARLSRVPSLIRATAWATLPPIRRLVDRAIAVTVTTAALASPIAPAIAEEAPPTTEPIIYQITDDGVATPLNPPTIEPTLVTPPGTIGAGYTPSPAGGVEMGDEAAAHTEATYTVAKGDNLWTISASHLRAAFAGRPVDAAEISTY
ncbi:MAG: hypothetical protein HKN91_06605, partial [Acidimicrobiia bacterium]|nr:hypothetical protein [Acidimicrobiia bacterium]